MDARPAPHNLAPAAAALFGPARPPFPKNGLGLFWSSPSVSRYDTEEPFGVELPPIQDFTGNTHKFTGQEYDASTGLYNYHARMMAPNFGRFGSPDPLTESARLTLPQTFNRYSYAANNPLIYTDPSGMFIPEVDEYGSIFMTVEEGDNLQDLADQWGVEMSSFGIDDPGSLQVGQKIDVSNVVPDFICETIRQQASMPNYPGYDLKKPIRTDANCWGTATSFLSGNPRVAGIPKPWMADTALVTLGTQLPANADAVLGDAVRYGGPGFGETTHFATFFVKDKCGEVYVFSKSGYNGPYEIQKASTLSGSVYDYGAIQGISGGSGFYEARRP